LSCHRHQPTPLDAVNGIGVYVESNQLLRPNEIAWQKIHRTFAENISTISAGIHKLDYFGKKLEMVKRFG